MKHIVPLLILLYIAPASGAPASRSRVTGIPNAKKIREMLVKLVNHKKYMADHNMCEVNAAIFTSIDRIQQKLDITSGKSDECFAKNILMIRENLMLILPGLTSTFHDSALSKTIDIIAWAETILNQSSER